MNNDPVFTASNALAMIAALAPDTTLKPDEVGFATGLPDGGRLEMSLSCSGPVITFINPDGMLQRPFVLNVFGDCHSPAYWAPTGLIDPWHYGEDWDSLSELKLASLVERAQLLRSRVTLAGDDTAFSKHGRITAVINYLRATSGCSQPWAISLAPPFEVFADSRDQSGECTTELGDQPAGLREIGECAVVSVECMEDGFSVITVRPAMLAFRSRVSGSAIGQERALERLRALKFTQEDIEELNDVAAMVRGCTSIW